MRVDLNADCGESYGPWSKGDDAGIMEVVTSANIACGGHAGDPETMAAALDMAKEKGVAAGAHPGYADPLGFGRRVIPMTPRAVELMVAYQIGAMLAVAANRGVAIGHVKAHGALSNHAMRDRETAEAIARAVRSVDANLTLLAVAATELQRAGENAGLDVACEVFADRTYRADATLTPRSEPGSVLHDAEDCAARVVRMVKEGAIFAEDGKRVPVSVDSICVHGDEPSAVAVARTVRAALEAKGVEVRSFA